MSDSLHSLPKLEHIPLLEGSHNAHEWFRAMSQVLKAERVWGHVEGVDNDPTAIWQASYPPTLTANSTNAQRQTSLAWWIKDSCAIAIIDCRLNSISKAHLPSDDNTTARTIWKKLRSLYDCVDINAQWKLRDQIDANVFQGPSDYMRFIGEFDHCRARLASMGCPISDDDAIHTLLRQIPNNGSWPQFKLSISHFVQTWREFDANRDPLAPAPPDSLYSKIVAHLKQECLSVAATSTKNGPGSEYINFAASSTIKKTLRNPLGVACTNCGLDTHDFNHCWKQGGSAAGQWPGGPNNPKSKVSKLTSTLSVATSKPQADLVAVILPLTYSDVANVSSYPESYDLSC